MQDNTQNIEEIRLEAITEEMQKRVDEIKNEFELLNDILSEPKVEYETAVGLCDIIKGLFNEFDLLKKQRQALIPEEFPMIIEVADLRRKFQDKEKEIRLIHKERSKFKDISTRLTNASMQYSSCFLQIEEVIENEALYVAMLVGTEPTYHVLTKELDSLAVSLSAFAKRIKKQYGKSNPIFKDNEIKKLSSLIAGNVPIRENVDRALKKYSKKMQDYRKQAQEKVPASKNEGKKNSKSNIKSVKTKEPCIEKVQENKPGASLVFLTPSLHHEKAQNNMEESAKTSKDVENKLGVNNPLPAQENSPLMEKYRGHRFFADRPEDERSKSDILEISAVQTTFNHNASFENIDNKPSLNKSKTADQMPMVQNMPAFLRAVARSDVEQRVRFYREGPFLSRAEKHRSFTDFEIPELQEVWRTFYNQT